MAASPEKTIKDLTGKWQMNKSLGDSPDPALTLQGIGWLLRKAIGLATVTLNIKQYEGPVEDAPAGSPNVTHIDINQTATGGVKGTTENRNLDNKIRPHSDYLFGDLVARSTWTTLAELSTENAGKHYVEEDKKYLSEGWLAETTDGPVVESWVENEAKGWTAWQVWGFKEVEGKRMYARKLVVRKGEDVHRMTFFYDYLGPLES